MPPRIVHDPAQFCDACDEARAKGSKVALIPTLGALHDGHVALVVEAKKHASFVAVSIFVNPTQFGPKEDFSRYPRTLDADVAKLAAVGVDVVFAPEAPAMYPPGDATRVNVASLATHLCGPFRPGHFEGVATVVAKLFALAGPSVAVFGRKDYQQLAIVRRLATDLFLRAHIIGLATVREPDGLARSSRNAYLDEDGRKRALGLVTGLRAAFDLFAAGERSAGALRKAARAPVEASARAIDYVDVADPDTLEPYADDARVGERALVAIAAHVGSTRLIDNVVLGEDQRPSFRGDTPHPGGNSP